ncbi:MAG: udgA [Candidatus Kaiserbacteria bacterium]|nr:udgA [Candidatus Kaiserbacteria bacterium]
MIEKTNKTPLIGFIGQGWVGNNYANDFEARGYSVIRYSLDEQYRTNKDLIKDCEIVFICVPTPTTQNGFDSSIVESCLLLVGKGNIAVIKSTILPGTTNSLQEKNQEIFVFHSPEFLRETLAAYDASHPQRNIIGIPEDTAINHEKAELVLSTLATAPYNKIMQAREAELVKYIGNCFLYEKVVFFNQMYDLAVSMNLDVASITEAVTRDPRIGESHTTVVHASGHDETAVGRGAGGHCFIKDFEALLEMYKKNLPTDIKGYEALFSIREKNNDYLITSGKDKELLEGVIGSITQES